MAFERRHGKPYIWASWIGPYVSGEKHCAWAVWFRAHFRYDKRPQDGENTLVKWQADHAAMVAAKAATLRMDGYDVTVEQQNSFTYVGRTAIVGAKPDLIAIGQTPGAVRAIATGDAPLDFGPPLASVMHAAVVDCKTGKERDSDVVQVAFYMLLGPDSEAHESLKGLPIRGEVAYQTRTRPVSYADARALLPAIVTCVQAAAGDVEPRTTPSAGECRWCDILDCKDRVDDAATIESPPVSDAVF